MDKWYLAGNPDVERECKKSIVEILRSINACAQRVKSVKIT